MAIISTEGWSEDRAKTFLSTLVEDGKLDEGEVELLKALSSAAGPVTFEERSIPVADGRARELLVLLSDPPNLHTLWRGTPQQFQQLVDLSTISPRLQQRVLQFIRNQFQPLWEQSTLLNSYSPLVHEISRCYNLLEPSGEPTLERGVHLLCYALNSLENPKSKNHRGFLYLWMLRPYQEKGQVGN